MRLKVLRDRATGRVLGWQTKEQHLSGPMLETDTQVLEERETTEETLATLSAMQAPPPPVEGLLGELENIRKAAGKKPGDPVTFGDIETVAINRNGGKL